MIVLSRSFSVNNSTNESMIFQSTADKSLSALVLRIVLSGSGGTVTKNVCMGVRQRTKQFYGDGSALTGRTRLCLHVSHAIPV